MPSTLPLDIFYNVLDQLVGTRDGLQPIAREPTDPVTKTLYSLILVSRNIHPIASQYLYSYCVCLNNCTNYARFRRSIGLSLLENPRALEYRESCPDKKNSADTSQYITSALISPLTSGKDKDVMLSVKLPQVIDLCKAIGQTLKRLALDLRAVSIEGNAIEHETQCSSKNNIFLSMLHLEELLASFDVLDFFPIPPPNLKRLAITFQSLGDTQLDYCFATSSLQELLFLRPKELLAKDIDLIFSLYKGKSLDIMLVDVNYNHRTPVGTRTWTHHDNVRIWEIDVPTSFYGDDDELALCDEYVWRHGVKGTIWTHSKRPMASWADIQRRLAGPVHLIMDSAL